jgi:hypothetical protein
MKWDWSFFLFFMENLLPYIVYILVLIEVILFVAHIILDGLMGKKSGNLNVSGIVLCLAWAILAFHAGIAVFGHSYWIDYMPVVFDILLIVAFVLNVVSTIGIAKKKHWAKAVVLITVILETLVLLPLTVLLAPNGMTLCCIGLLVVAVGRFVFAFTLNLRECRESASPVEPALARSGKEDYAYKFEQIKKLYEDGLITEEEYNAKRKDLIDNL